MQKASLLILSFFFFIDFASAQFYYKDLVSNAQLVSDMKLYKENRVKTVRIKSFEDDGTESDGFFCQKNVSRDYRRTELMTRSNISSRSMLISLFDKEGKLLSTNDSSDISVSRTNYVYDLQNLISRILTSVRSQDDDFTNAISEEHIYEYNAQNQPVKMTRVKNRIDSSVISFATDENNNIAIEKDSKSGSKYYYYYDAKKRLTDIVQTNDFRTNLHPDYIFEYNSANQVTQMTVTEEGGNDYFVWKYVYDNGLRSGERCYTKERKLMGSVAYEYN